MDLGRLKADHTRWGKRDKVPSRLNRQYLWDYPMRPAGTQGLDPMEEHVND